MTAQPGCTACPRRSAYPQPSGRRALMHLAMLGLLVWFGWLFAFGLAGWLGVAAVGLLLAYEHSMVSPRRPAPAERRILHHERRHRHGLSGLCGRGSVAAEVKRRCLQSEIPKEAAVAAVVWCQEAVRAGRLSTAGSRQTELESAAME